eukprot:TRINITY_DN3031_c3_g1_i2.p1 TRINITY_DN3031_c3_g1~~TRINITY_DN3031_c3_g1_i2.p1  ORF type:complete len:501 (-),score=135.01 TRINITY_DN3031_c3_g1_i2:38-1540(-)
MSSYEHWNTEGNSHFRSKPRQSTRYYDKDDGYNNYHKESRYSKKRKIDSFDSHSKPNRFEDGYSPRRDYRHSPKRRKTDDRQYRHVEEKPSRYRDLDNRRFPDERVGNRANDPDYRRKGSYKSREYGTPPPEYDMERVYPRDDVDGRGIKKSKRRDPYYENGRNYDSPLIKDEYDPEKASEERVDTSMEVEKDSPKADDENEEDDLPAQTEVILMMKNKDGEIASLEKLLQTTRERREEVRNTVPPFLKNVPKTSNNYMNAKITDPTILHIIQKNKENGEIARDYYSQNLETSVVFNDISDIDIRKQTIKNHAKIRPHLIRTIGKNKVAQRNKFAALQTEYKNRIIEWKKYLKNKQDSRPKKKRKRRTRRGSRKDATPIPSLEEIRERVSKTIATIPPLILDTRKRNTFFIDKNRIVPNTKEVLESKIIEEVWLPQEEASFLELFAKYKKNFEKISKHLANKTCKDCIKFYYVNKFRLNLKTIQTDKKKIQLGMREYTYI